MQPRLCTQTSRRQCSHHGDDDHLLEGMRFGPWVETLGRKPARLQRGCIESDETNRSNATSPLGV